MLRSLSLCLHPALTLFDQPKINKRTPTTNALIITLALSNFQALSLYHVYNILQCNLIDKKLSHLSAKFAARFRYFICYKTNTKRARERERQTIIKHGQRYATLTIEA